MAERINADQIMVGRGYSEQVEFSATVAPLAARLEAPAREVIARYPKGRERSALLPLLHLVQSEQGCVTPQGQAFCAEILGLTRAEVSAVATFYTMYKRRPVGDYLVSVCTNTMCGVLGGDAVYQALAEHLGVGHDAGHSGGLEADHRGVGHDSPSADGQITLEHAECLAACDYAPVMTVNYDFFDQVDVDGAVELVKQLQNGERPQPSRGGPLCTFREIQVQLAGFADEREGAVAAGPAGEPTIAGNRLAAQYGITVAGFDPETPITKAGSAGTTKPPATAPRPASDAKPAGDTPPATAPRPASDGKPAGDTPPAAKGPAR